MRKQKILLLAAVLILGIGAVYAVGTEYVQFGAPTQTEIEASISQAVDVVTQKMMQEVQASSATQKQRLSELEAQVKQLEGELQKAEEVGETQTPETSPTPTSAAPPAPAPESIPDSKSLTVQAPAVPPTPPAKVQNAGTVFEGFTVTVADKNIPAIRAAGTDWPITTFYFIASDGTKLGSISGTAMNKIIEKYQTASGDAPGVSGEWEFWFADRFNEYRDISENTTYPDEGNGFGGSDVVSSIETEFDSYGLSAEAFELVNRALADAGLDEVQKDATMMDLAAMRAEELEDKYDHVRPNGSKMSTDYKYAEIINRRANTAAIAVSSWLDCSSSSWTKSPANPLRV